MFKRAIPFKEFWESGSKDLREIIFNIHDMSIENWMKLYSYTSQTTKSLHVQFSFYSIPFYNIEPFTITCAAMGPT